MSRTAQRRDLVNERESRVLAPVVAKVVERLRRPPPRRRPRSSGVPPRAESARPTANVQPLDPRIFEIDAEVASLDRALSSTERALEVLYGRYFTDYAEPGDWRSSVRVACVRVATNFRRELGGALSTRLPLARLNAQCVDLVTDAPLLDYCEALTEDTPNTAIGMKALHEFATTISTCLRTDQAFAADHALATAVDEAMLYVAPHDPTNRIRRSLAQITANFLLLSYDANKHRMSGANATQLASHATLARLRPTLSQSQYNQHSIAASMGVWLYDRFNGGIARVLLNPDECEGMASAEGVDSCAGPQMSPCPGLASFMAAALDVGSVSGGCGLGETAAVGLSCSEAKQGCGTGPGGGGGIGQCVASSGDLGANLTSRLFCAPGGGLMPRPGNSDPSPTQFADGSAVASAPAGRRRGETIYEGVQDGGCNLLGALSGVATAEGGGDQSTEDPKRAQAEAGAKQELDKAKIIDAVKGALQSSDLSSEQRAALQMALANLEKNGDAYIAAARMLIDGHEQKSIPTPDGDKGKGVYVEAEGVIYVDPTATADSLEYAEVLAHEAIHAILDWAGTTDGETDHVVLQRLGLQCDPTSDACTCSALGEQIGNLNHCFTLDPDFDTNDPGFTRETCIVAGGWQACEGNAIDPSIPSAPGSAGRDVILECTGAFEDAPELDDECWMVQCTPNGVPAAGEGGTDVLGCCSGGGAPSGASGVDPTTLPDHGLVDPDPR